MRTILAALDSSPVATRVLATAVQLGAWTDACVDAVHVATDAAAPPPGAAARWRTLAGPVEAALLREIVDERVVLAAFGLRGEPHGPQPGGHVVMHVLAASAKPVVVVPPDATEPIRPIRRLLVPLEGTEASSAPILDRLRPLAAQDTEFVVLHVFTADTLPRMLDRAEHDLPLLAGEFGARFCPPATRVHLRTGAIGEQVAELAAYEDVDLVVLTWSRDCSPGHAAVIREVLASSAVPVLLLPVASQV